MKKSIVIWWWTLGLGVLLMCGSLVGVAGTIFQMQEVMLEIENNTQTSNDIGALKDDMENMSSHISEGMNKSMMSTFIGMGVGTLGLIVVVAAIIGLIVCHSKARRPQVPPEANP